MSSWTRMAVNQRGDWNCIESDGMSSYLSTSAVFSTVIMGLCELNSNVKDSMFSSVKLDQMMTSLNSAKQNKFHRQFNHIFALHHIWTIPKICIRTLTADRSILKMKCWAHGAIYSPCDIEACTGNLHVHVDQCCPNTFNLKNEM